MLLTLSAALAASCLDAGDVQRFRVDIDFVQSVVSERWTVDIPSTGCDLEPLPAPLGGARVEEPVAGPDGRSTVELRRVEVLSGAGSGSLRPWRAPASVTEVRFRAPESVPLQVFTGERAHRFASGDRLDVWWPKGENEPADLIWSSWADWVKAGGTLEAPILRGLPSTSELGTLGRSLRRAEVSTLVDRLDTTLDVLDDPDDVAWESGREAADVLATGKGTATERGRILLAMLRAAGFTARPAWFTPDDDPAVPRTLPAPHLLVYPAVAVRVGKEMLYLDPGTTGARPPAVPARMRGGRVLVAGRHLTVPIDTGAPRGEVRIDARLEVARSGQITTVAEILPIGAAEQVLRSRFSGLPAEQWPGVVEKWVTPRGGSLRGLVVDVKGLDGLVPFQLTLRFQEPNKLQGTGTTLRGPVRDLLAPGLAAMLPPGIAIEERLLVVPPEGTMALTAIRPTHVPSAVVLLNRSLASQDNDLLLASDWRVLGVTPPGAALEALPKDTEVLLFPADASARRAAKRLELPDEDLRVIDAMLLWRLDEPAKARRMLDKLHPKLSVVELADLVANYVSPGDRRPWEALIVLVDSDDERLAVIDNLVRTGDRRLAWRLATFMAKYSEEPLTRAKALVQFARFQGDEQPDGQADPEGFRAWRDPIKLLQKASSLAGDRQDLVRLELARAYLRANTPMEALDLLEEAMEAPTPLTKAVRAEFGAMTGVYGIDVLGLVDQALSEAPFDPDVREAAGRARALLGRRREGVADILLAAELAGNDTARWMTAAQFSADFGDLRAAVFAARRASDLQPNGLVQGVRLQLLAKLARNEDALALAVKRSGGVALYAETPDDLESLIALAEEQNPLSEYEQELGIPHPWELALLRHHVGDVESSRALLLERAELHHERGMAEDAALDGSLLLDRHNAGEGARFLLGGVTSRFRHAHPFDLIRRHLGSDAVRSARIDLDLVLGNRPMAAGDKERRRVVNLLRSNPARLALEAPTWPVAMRDFELAPPEGFTVNRTLSKVEGVLAWSDEERQMTILITEKPAGGLPPPLQNLYTTGPTVLSTDRGATVVRLDGGAIPLYAGITLWKQHDVVGLGLSPSTARDAVLFGIGALERPMIDEE